MRVDGKRIAGQIIAGLKARLTPKLHLTAVWVGESPASESFLKQKEKIADELGIKFRLVRFPETIATNTLAEEVRRIGADTHCGGIVLQLSLPAHIDRDAIIAALPAGLDVDALKGQGTALPPAVGVVQKLFDTYDVELAAKAVVVVGAGFLVGTPIARWIDGRAKALFIVDKGDDFEPLKTADVVISGAGVPGLLRPKMLKFGTIAIDFGYGMKDGRVMGDFDPACESTCSFFTPTPGGTGPILVAKLFANFYTLCEAHGRT